MDYYINTQCANCDPLKRDPRRLVLNDSEAKLLTGDENLVLAVRVCAYGLRFVVIRKAKHVVMLSAEHETYAAGLSRTAEGSIPTACGDKFCRHDTDVADADDFVPSTLKEALGYGIKAQFHCWRISSFDGRSTRTSTAEDLESPWPSIDG